MRVAHLVSFCSPQLGGAETRVAEAELLVAGARPADGSVTDVDSGDLL